MPKNRKKDHKHNTRAMESTVIWLKAFGGSGDLVAACACYHHPTEFPVSLRIYTRAYSLDNSSSVSYTPSLLQQLF
jgi:uncharacterized membrane protein YsdA (DUF1294 family)